MKRATAWMGAIVFLMLSLICFGLAAAQTLPTSGSDVDVTKHVYHAVRSGDWRLPAAFVLLLLVSFVRWIVPRLHSRIGAFLNSDPGASLLVLLSGFAAALVNANMAGEPWSWGVVQTAAEVSLTAAGGYSIGKRMLPNRWRKE